MASIHTLVGMGASVSRVVPFPFASAAGHTGVVEWLLLGEGGGGSC